MLLKFKHIAQNPRIYVLENGNWCVKGQYRDILEDTEEEEEVEWSYSGGVFSLTMCLVSTQYDLISCYLAMQEYELPSTSSTPLSVSTAAHSTAPAPESKAVHGQLSTEELISALDIPRHLAVKSTKDAGLRLYYAKYQACLEALNSMDKKFREGNWPAPKKATKTTVIELFVSKTMWHSHVNHHFKNLSDHPEMKMWLEEADGAPSDLHLWGYKKSDYTFMDLDDYMKNKEELENKKGKSKAHKKGDEKGNKNEGKM